MRKVLSALAISGAMACAIAGGAAISAPDRDGKSVAMQPAGNPIDCVNLRQIRSTEIIDDSTIDFKMAGGKILRNKLPYRCPSLKSEDAFSYRTSLTQLCSIDTIRVLQSYGGRLQEGTSCGLGKFQPIEPAPGN